MCAYFQGEVCPEARNYEVANVVVSPRLLSFFLLHAFIVIVRRRCRSNKCIFVFATVLHTTLRVYRIDSIIAYILY